jgi:branched-chain amino acid transport system permease protein
MGIDVRTVMTVTVMISMMICCLIGLLVSPLLNITTTMSNMIGLKGFAAGVIGGFGYLPGAILGGLCIGIVENIASMVLPSVYKDIVAFVLLVGFLLIRPAGITGKTR